MKIIEQKLITSPYDIMELDIIDFNRLNGSWKNPGDALKTIFSWFNNMATVTIAEIPDFDKCEKRDDFPGWNHVGNHVEIGMDYWNWFNHNHPKGKLTFTDSPDFYGDLGNGKWFYGDIGKVSASAFALTQKALRDGDLWISIKYGGQEQVVIEPHINIVKTFNEGFLDI